MRYQISGRDHECWLRTSAGDVAASHPFICCYVQQKREVLRILRLLSVFLMSTSRLRLQGGAALAPVVTKCYNGSVRGGLAVSPGKPPSHTARSGQEPHTPGGPKRVLRVGGEPRKPRSHTLRSGEEPYTPGGTVCAARNSVAALPLPAADLRTWGHFTISKEIGYLALDNTRRSSHRTSSRSVPHYCCASVDEHIAHTPSVCAAPVHGTPFMSLSTLRLGLSARSTSSCNPCDGC